MATIVNARDVLLQAATPRVASISMASNLVVSQSQVTGLGTVVEGTRLVLVEASTQVFQIAKNGTVSPTSTTLTAVVRNITGTPSLTVISGTITPTPTLSGGQVVINASALITDTATLRVTAVEGSTTYSDEITIVKVREGIDSLNGFLTNENHTLAADYLNNPINYTGAGGTFKVFQGTTDVTSLCTFSLVSNPDSLTQSIGASTGVYSVTGGFGVGINTTTVTYRATLGSATLDKVFTLSKAKAAVPNKTLAITATSQVFQVPKGGGAVTPLSITFGTISQNLSGSPAYSVVPSGVTITQGGGTANLTYVNMGSNDAATITVTQDGLTDQITVVKVREGTDTIASVLSNEAHVVPSDAAGGNVNYAGAATTFVIYEGTTDVTNSWAFTATPNNCTVTPTSIPAGATAKTFTVSAMTADVVYVDIVATRTGYPSQSKRFTVSKSKQGVQGNTGNTGQRGSRTFYVALSGSTNTWSSTLATTTASVDGGPVLNDTVTQYNNSQNFSETRFWDGAAWVVVNAVIDGNLLVSGTVGASKISVTTLTAIQASLGTAQIDANGYLRTSGATAHMTGNGIWMGYDSTTYKFRVGNPSGQYLSWDGSALTFTGALNVKSAASGERTEMTNSYIKVFDSTGTLRVQLGNLSA